MNLHLSLQKNSEFSPNFLVLEFRGNTLFPQSFVQFTRNSGETVARFLQNFHIRELGESTVFYAVYNRHLLKNVIL